YRKKLGTLSVRSYLNDKLPHRWIGRRADDDLFLNQWPPKQPSFNSLRFFWCYIKDEEVFSLPLSANNDELNPLITEVIQTVTQNGLENKWVVSSYRLDISRVLGGGHIEHL
ncbi:hypothetical protein AVEN_164627-1, partial [Araneus ventricosus]